MTANTNPNNNLFGYDTITISFDDDLSSNINGLQYDMFPTMNTGAATITGAVGNLSPHVTLGGTGAAGGYGYTISNTLGNLSYNGNWIVGSNDTKGLSVQGDAEFEGDVKIKGKSITEMFENIEKRLAILHPNEKLESKWEELKALGDRYRELEKEITEKEKVWDILKK